MLKIAQLQSENYNTTNKHSLYDMHVASLTNLNSETNFENSDPHWRFLYAKMVKQNLSFHTYERRCVVWGGGGFFPVKIILNSRKKFENFGSYQTEKLKTFAVLNLTTLRYIRLILGTYSWRIQLPTGNCNNVINFFSHKYSISFTM